jgi:beta-lactamase class A
MCSAFELLASAGVLKLVEQGKESLNRTIAYGPADLLEYAPVTKAHVGQGGMRLDDLCAAAVDWSDNTAANLILSVIGGPEGFTRFARSLGDETTRLDRDEPSLNTAIPGDDRDTTTGASGRSRSSSALFAAIRASNSSMLVDNTGGSGSRWCRCTRHPDWETVASPTRSARTSPRTELPM